MVMTPISSNSLSNYGNRPVTLEVTGICNQQVMRTGIYTMTTSYNRLSQTIRGVHRMGGKVAKVTMNSAAPAPVIKSEPVVSPARSPEPVKMQGFQPPKKKRKQKG
jgi:CpcD/allophycocyanin linker domain